MCCKNLDTLTIFLAGGELVECFLFLENMFLAFLSLLSLYNFVNYSFSVILKIPPRIYIKLSVYISKLNFAFCS